VFYLKQNKTCVQTLKGHSQNVGCIAFHPALPIILSGSEDKTVKIWHSDTWCLESTLNFDLGRCWTISCLKGSNNAALGYDEGTLMIKVEKRISRKKGNNAIFYCFSWIQKSRTCQWMHQQITLLIKEKKANYTTISLSMHYIK
jgi:coatomer subunit beta'